MGKKVFFFLQCRTLVPSAVSLLNISGFLFFSTVPVKLLSNCCWCFTILLGSYGANVKRSGSFSLFSSYYLWQEIDVPDKDLCNLSALYKLLSRNTPEHNAQQIAKRTVWNFSAFWGLSVALRKWLVVCGLEASVRPCSKLPQSTIPRSQWKHFQLLLTYSGAASQVTAIMCCKTQGVCLPDC